VDKLCCPNRRTAVYAPCLLFFLSLIALGACAYKQSYTAENIPGPVLLGTLAIEPGSEGIESRPTVTFQTGLPEGRIDDALLSLLESPQDSIRVDMIRFGSWSAIMLFPGGLLPGGMGGGGNWIGLSGEVYPRQGAGAYDKKK